MCCFWAGIMSKSDKSFLPLWKKEHFFAVCIEVEILFTDNDRGLY